MTPEHIALIQHSKHLIQQLSDILLQLDQTSNAMLPPRKPSKKFDPETWGTKKKNASAKLRSSLTG